MERTGMAGLEAEISREREVVRDRSPPYERALALLPSVLAGPAGRYVEAAWEHRHFFAWYDRPLLLLASLRDDALASGPSHPLYQGLAVEEPDPTSITAERLGAALDGSRERLFDSLAQRSVRTNDPARAIAWLWPAALAGASAGGRILAIAEVGAGAGLNLLADVLPPMWTASDGSPVETAREVQAVARLGLDPAPLDALSDDDARWLRACLRPGERRREERLEQAIAVFRAGRVRRDAPVLLPIVARNVPPRLDLLSAAASGALVLAYQTMVRDDLEPGERDEYEAGMREWLGTHPPGQALWVELEPAGDGAELACGLVAHVRMRTGELRSVELARCEREPAVLEVRHGGEAELRALLGSEAHVGARA